MQIKDRSFIVSGGSSGLGLATAKTLLQNGGNVSILDLRPPPSDSALDDSRMLFTSTDVASSESLLLAIKATVKWMRETSKPLSGIVCSAGINSASLSLPKQNLSTTNESVKYYDMYDFDRVVAINLRGTIDLIRLALPHMACNEPYGHDNERGVIIVVSSIAAYDGQVGQMAYSASKGAIRSIVLPLARELGQKAGIRAMGIAPGFFKTAMSTKPTSTQSPKPVGLQERTESPSTSHLEKLLYPKRMGEAHEFASLVKEVIENPMLNGFVIRLDGAVRLPPRF